MAWTRSVAYNKRISAENEVPKFNQSQMLNAADTFQRPRRNDQTVATTF